MNETWANAPSLEHEFMILEKKKSWFDQFLKTMMQVMIFENKWVRHVGIPQFDLKKSFWVLNGPKKMSENAKSHGIAWVSDGGAKCHF